MSAVGDPELRAELETLLRNLTVGTTAIEKGTDPLSEVLRRPARLAPPLPLAAEEPAGMRIGPYRLLEEIGRGGMGVVYRAEREDDFNKIVALKLVARPGPGWVERLRRERQLLARLEHPHIARLLDGGSTDDGVLYLVMEHVEGEPLSVYARRRRLTVSQRLELFLQICDAVAFAHRNLVIHRDIKPGNILVTKTGEAKLLDFGIAERADVDPAPGDSRTHAMTPSHAAPEQILGAAVGMTSDVYSLGVVLYQLLTDRLPLDIGGLSLAQLVDVVGRRPPEPPSRCVRESDPATRDAVAAARRTTPRRLERRLRGELDAIVLDALQKDPEARCPSVDRLSLDVRRFLADRPVEAFDGGRLYVLSKWVRRHRTAVALAGLAVVLLLTLGANELADFAKQHRNAVAVISYLESSLEVFDPHPDVGDAKPDDARN